MPDASHTPTAVREPVDRDRHNAGSPFPRGATWDGDGVWHIRAAAVRPGQLYGYRAYARYHPEQGLRFNPNKLLLDPYAKAIGRPLKWSDKLFGYTDGDPHGDMSFDVGAIATRLAGSADLCEATHRPPSTSICSQLR